LRPFDPVKSVFLQLWRKGQALGFDQSHCLDQSLTFCLSVIFFSKQAPSANARTARIQHATDASRISDAGAIVGDGVSR
jgi:hypothetical protein